MEGNPGALLEIFLWRNFIILASTTKFLIMYMEECKTMVHGEVQPMFGRFKVFEIPTGKKLPLVMVLMWFQIKTIRAMAMP